jgi:hypothetical protein
VRFLVCSDAHHVGDLEILIQFPILIDMFQHSLKTTSEQASLEKKNTLFRANDPVAIISVGQNQAWE